MKFMKRIFQGLLSLFILAGLPITKSLPNNNLVQNVKEKLINQDKRINISNKYALILTLGMASCKSVGGPAGPGHGSHSSHASHSSHRSSIS